ncbi:MAG: FG-GAP repeat protein [Planctomycetota bacterium]
MKRIEGRSAFLVLIAGTMAILTSVARAQQLGDCDPMQLDKLFGAASQNNDQVGRSVAIDRSWALVASRQGHVTAYRDTARGWEVAQELVPVGGAPVGYGSDIALDGHRALIGARESSRAFVFGFDGVEWREEAVLIPSGLSSRDEAGFSVALRGDLAILGAPRRNQLQGSGSAVVFRFDGVLWNEEQLLVPSQGQDRDYFGASVDVEGDRIVIGAFNEGNSGQSFPDGTGAVYAFTFDPVASVWNETQRLVSPFPEAGELDQFGYDLDLDGERLLVGTNPISFSVTPIGSAYVFVESGGFWAMETKLVSPDGSGGDRFGSAVALDGDVALIGAWGVWSTGESCPFPQICDAGQAYVFVRRRIGWTPRAIFTAADIDQKDHFGWSVGLDGPNAIIGAWGDDDQGSSAGAAYVYDVRGCIPPSLGLGR